MSVSFKPPKSKTLSWAYYKNNDSHLETTKLMIRFVILGNLQGICQSHSPGGMFQGMFPAYGSLSFVCVSQ